MRIYLVCCVRENMRVLVEVLRSGKSNSEVGAAALIGLSAGSVDCGVLSRFEEPEISTLVNTNVCVSISCAAFVRICAYLLESYGAQRASSYLKSSTGWYLHAQNNVSRHSWKTHNVVDM